MDKAYRKELREISVVLVNESKQYMNSGSYDIFECDDNSGEDNRGEDAGDGEVSKNELTKVKGNAGYNSVG